MANATEWSERVEAWRASGLEAEEWVRGRGFAASTLRWWTSRLKQVERARSAERNKAPASATASSGVRIARVVRSEPAASVAAASSASAPSAASAENAPAARPRMTTAPSVVVEVRGVRVVVPLGADRDTLASIFDALVHVLGARGAS